MRRVHKNLCPATISVSIMAANMWKNSLKTVESDNNKILYETLLDFFLQRNGIYCLNKPRSIYKGWKKRVQGFVVRYLSERKELGDIAVGGMIIIKWILKKLDGGGVD